MAVTIKGLASLEAKLNKLDPMTRAAALKGVQRAGELVKGSAKNLSPVDTGALRQSISSTSSSTATGAEAEVGTGVEYAPYVELGTSRQAAQPYLHPALQKNKHKATKLIRDEIKAAYKGL